MIWHKNQISGFDSQLSKCFLILFTSKYMRYIIKVQATSKRTRVPHYYPYSRMY